MGITALEPFRFCTRLALTEVTGRRAYNIEELLEGIKAADDAIIYHHTHRFIKQAHHLAPEGANDFASFIFLEEQHAAAARVLRTRDRKKRTAGMDKEVRHVAIRVERTGPALVQGRGRSALPTAGQPRFYLTQGVCL